MKNIIIFDKGGRKDRINLMKLKKAPKDFLQGLDYARSKGYKIENICSNEPYKENIIFKLGSFLEKIQAKISGIGLRPFSVHNFAKTINSSDGIISLTDGFSLSLGFYFIFKSKKKITIGAFHKLSDYDKKIPFFLKKLYKLLLIKILKNLDHIAFYGPADREHAIKIFKLKRDLTSIIKFGVDTDFWYPKSKKIISNYIFSIGQDPARDFETLIKINTKKNIHIHTSKNLKSKKSTLIVTHGSYHNPKESMSDLELRDLYRNSFVVIVPLKDVYQPSGYSVTLQAMACGKPVILTLTKGIWSPSILVDKFNCILVKPGNVRDIEKAIKFLEKDKLFYDAICKNARLTIEKEFSLSTMNNSMLNLCSKIRNLK